MNFSELLAHAEMEKILDSILEKAIQSTNSDGGSIYFIEKISQDSYGGARPHFRKVLKFYRSMNRHLETQPFRTQWIEIDRDSIAGYVAMSGDTVRLDDCYQLPANAPFKFFPTFDQQMSYRTKSVLAVPIKTPNEEVVGVVQLINKLNLLQRYDDPPRAVSATEILEFSEADLSIINALASQAGIAIENARLTQDIANLFESFVRASVTAIEARDPSTSGHSDRVALMTVDFAKAIDRVDSGNFRDIRFNPQQLQEIRYASLLHDFGKIGVKERVLLKAKKLYPNELETVMLRLDTIRAANEAKTWRIAAEKAAKMSKAHAEKEIVQALWRVDQFNRQLEKVRDGIIKANESQVMDGDFDIKGLMDWVMKAASKVDQKVLTDEEYKRLSIPRGTLDEHERREIESHVTHTFQFLSQINWTDGFAKVPEIAHAHHEKLDGTGYPLNLRADQIPIQSRMMSISDIFDALTAMDRPYKKAVSTQRALDILTLESNQGKLDKDLLKIFVEAQVFQQALMYKKTG